MNITEPKEEVLCSGGNTMKFVKVTNEDGTKVVKFTYSMELDVKEDIFNEIFNDYGKIAKNLFEKVNSTLSSSTTQ
jgi:hypothetical protein